MKTLIRTLTVLLSLGLSIGPALAHDDSEGEDLAVSEAPEAVQETLEEEAQDGGEIEELRKQVHDNGQTVYTAEIVRDGEGTEIHVSPDGSVLRRGEPHDESEEHEHHHE
jgi:hypothetical protein